MRKFLMVSLMGMTLVALAAAPAAAQYVAPPPDTTVSDTTVVPGEPLTVFGDLWFAGSEVNLHFFSTPVFLGTAQVAADGTFSKQVTIPADATPGQHIIRTTGFGLEGQPRTVDVALTVVAAQAGTPTTPVGPGQQPAQPAPGRGLPRTGGEPAQSMMLAAMLLAVGSTALVVARRRNRTEVGV